MRMLFFFLLLNMKNSIIATNYVHELRNLIVNNAHSYQYIPIKAITPGQLRYSELNVQEKVTAAKKKGTVQTIHGKNTYAYNNGTSILDKPLPIIIAPFGPVLVDGHHDLLASKELGASTVPVYVMADFSSLSPAEFWDHATKKGLVYPYTITKEHKIPTSFDELTDDPNRFFAALVARKCVKLTDGTMAATASPKTPLADYPIWVKFENQIPFIEFKISDVLADAAIFYKNEWGYSVSENFVEAARKALIKNPIPGLTLIPTRRQILDNSPEARALCTI